MLAHIGTALLVILALIICCAGYQALFGPAPRAERAERVLKVSLAVLGAALGLTADQEIAEWVRELVRSVTEMIETARVGQSP
ncbi:hypothetical protein BLA60_21650 [Actinophytocola xinjiangensis]|uniref:Uncharacterized protein n=1 Tax=Actinophytocola xinjiangensis TaxID=485602 RepID=A0A7Z1AXI3_9PSEU|nr:hypothetical protein [Actinophytocola xinjiangensis]OLF09178.1 hypothetical protein BLA60_21650 [Actinophytocola xinjiangensis]